VRLLVKAVKVSFAKLVMVSLDKVTFSKAAMVFEEDWATVALDEPSSVALDGNVAYRDVMQHIKTMKGIFLAKHNAVVLYHCPIARYIRNWPSHP
jgi:hypothetical protein